MAVLREADVDADQDAGHGSGAQEGALDQDMQQSEAGQADMSDRRRPGRIEVTNPHLIPVLRGAPDFEDGSAEETPRPAHESGTDDLSAAHGLMVGLLLAIPIWCAIIIGVSRMLR